MRSAHAGALAVLVDEDDAGGLKRALDGAGGVGATAEIAVGRLEKRMAFLGHSTPNEARTYVKKANRRELADQAWGCSKAQNENKVCPTVS